MNPTSFDKSFKIFFAGISFLIAFGFVAVIGALITAAVLNASGAHHTQAVEEAQAYALEASDAGADVQFVSCMTHDTDGDGYVACSFVVEGTPVTLDCAGKSLVWQNHGCKEYVAKLRVTGTSMTNHRPHRHRPM